MTIAVNAISVDTSGGDRDGSCRPVSGGVGLSLVNVEWVPAVVWWLWWLWWQ